MLCKVIDCTQEVEPVSWHSLTPKPASVPSANPFTQPATPPVPPAEVAALRARIAELERARQTEVAQVRQQAFQEGLQQARAEAATGIKSAIDGVAQTMIELSTVKRKLRSDAEKELLQLSLAIARRVLHRELATDPEALQALVHTALQKLQNREISRVRVCPDGADDVKAALQRFGAASAIHSDIGSGAEMRRSLLRNLFRRPGFLRRFSTPRNSARLC